MNFDTFVLLGCGPSLTQADVDFVRDQARVIAINNAYTLAPWAFCLYAADAKWWKWENGAPGFLGMKYSIESPHDPVTWPNVTVLKNTGLVGLDLDPHGLRAGFNSGYQAINLAVHFGARRIVLLGYDMAPNPHGPSHFFGEHPDKAPSPYEQMREAFLSLVEPLNDIGVEVVNCTPGSALTCFPSLPLRDVFAEVAA